MLSRWLYSGLVRIEAGSLLLASLYLHWWFWWGIDRGFSRLVGIDLQPAFVATFFTGYVVGRIVAKLQDGQRPPSLFFTAKA